MLGQSKLITSLENIRLVNILHFTALGNYLKYNFGILTSYIQPINQWQTLQVKRAPLQASAFLPRLKKSTLGGLSLDLSEVTSSIHYGIAFLL